MNVKKITKSFAKIALLFLIVFILLILVFLYAIRTPRVQTYIAQKVTYSLAEELDIPIQVGDVDIEFFNKINISNIFAQDKNNDTILYIKNIDANFSYFSIVQQKFTLKNLTATDAYFNLHRTYNDSVFVINTLGFNKKKASDKNKNPFDNTWDFIVRSAQLKNSRFVLDDEYGGVYLDAFVEDLLVDIDVFKLGDDLILLEELALNKPKVKLSLSSPNPLKKQGNKSSLFELPVSIRIKKANIDDGTFTFLNKKSENTAYNGSFNSNNIQLSNINLFSNAFKLDRNKLSLDIAHLNASNHNDFHIMKMKSKVAFNNNQLSLRNLLLKTIDSQFDANVILAYDSLADFKQFFTKVNVDFSLKPSSLYPNDFSYFLPAAKSKMRYPVFLSGDIKGTVNNFKSKKLSFRTASNVLFNGAFSMNGLPKIEETFISGKVSRLNIDYTDLKKLIPNLKLPPNLENLGLLKFKGRFDGFPKDFVMYGDFSTAIGRASTDLNFKLTDSNIPKYSGVINLKEFDLGKFFSNENLFGKVSMNVIGDGEGINLTNLNAQLDGEIEQIELKGYNYKNIDINGVVKNKFFKGDLNIDDENIKLDFKGQVDAKSKILDVKFNADVAHLNPFALNLWKNKMTFSGHVDADFRATNINDAVGDLNITDLHLNTQTKNYSLDEIKLYSRALVNGEKRIRIDADEVNGVIEGDFQLEKIPNTFKSVLLTNYKERIADQSIKFDIEIKENPEFLLFINPNLKLLEKSTFGGYINSNTSSLFAKLNIPVFKFNNLSVIDLNSNISIQSGEYDIINTIPSTYINDSVFIENLSFLVNGPRNYLNLKLNADGIKNTSIELLATLITKNKRLKLAFEPSNLFINNQYWLFDEKNEININEKIESKNLRIYNGLSELILNLDIGLEKQKADMMLNNIMLEDFTQFLEARDIALKGIVNGKIGMDVSSEKPGFFGDVFVENIEINDYHIGNLNANAELDLPNKRVWLNSNLYGKENEVNVNGSYSFAKQSTPKDFDINIDVKNLAVYTVEDFIPQYIDNSIGTVTGKLHLTGLRKKPNLLGYVDVNDVTTTVSYLQTTYNLKNHRVEFNKKGIYIGNNVIVRDEEGNVAHGQGWVYHNNLKNFVLDISVKTDKIQGLNTTYKDNSDFYGTAYIKGQVNFTGKTTDLLIDIEGESEPDSYLAIPLEGNSKTNQYEFYKFIEKDTIKDIEYLDKAKEKFKVNGLTVDLDLDLDQDIELSIILDKAAGDVLEVRGDGNLKINVPKEGDVQFYGNYIIAEGDYLFTLQNVVNKRFRIDPNSSLNFKGDIEETMVNVNAVYDLRAVPKPLIEDYLVGSSIDENLENDAKNRVPVSLLLKLSDQLYTPSIDFDIEVSQVGPTLRSYVDRKIVTLKQYDNEMNRQVFGLLVLNQFLPPLSNLDQISNGFNIDANDAANTVSEFLSNQITRYLNDWLSNFSDNVSFNFNYRNYEQDNSTSTVQDLALRRELQLALTTRFLNDRVIVNVGGNVDFGQNQLGANNSNTTFFGGNASIEYALTKNKRFRIKAFTLTDYDYLYQLNTTRAGVGLSFKREFDKFRDLKIGKEEFKFRDKEK